VKRADKTLELKAELFACIATLDNLMRNFQDGKIDPATYRRQFKSLLHDIFKYKQMLEEMNINVEDFIREERLDEKYPLAMRKFAKEGETEAPVLQTTTTSAKLAVKASDIVANLITIIDCTKLHDLVTIKMIAPLLEETITLLVNFPGLPPNYWVVVDMRNWLNKLLSMDPEAKLDAKTSKELEFQAVRWLNDFRLRLREMQ